MTTLEQSLKAVSIGEAPLCGSLASQSSAKLIKHNEELHKIYPNKLYGAFALQQREKYYKLTGKEYDSKKWTGTKRDWNRSRKMEVR